ncbi:hypothetical protein ACFSKL_07515 [Belliella marina]|uniref:DUF3575 domain-containing protein n=1 Tax=Belliella marina TaxID=1644146 RepID=A0ABW4VIU1_9BACT
MKYKLKFIYLLTIILFYQKQAQAQELLDENIKNEHNYAPATGISGSLLGSLIHPGFKVAIERPYKFTQIDKHRKHRTKTIYKERYLSYGLGMYHHINYHANYFSQTEWVARRQKSNGYYTESSLGLGISRTFVDGATFNVSDNGEVNKVFLAGNWFGLVSAGGALGYNANLKNKKNYSLYFKYNFLILFPYNSLVTVRPTIELGFNYNLSGFWEAKPKFKREQK